MKIQVLGSGCPTCKNLNDMVERALKELEMDEKVEYISGERGIAKIIEMGIMNSPVLVIDEEPVMIGFTPDIEQIKDLIKSRIITS